MWNYIDRYGYSSEAYAYNMTSIFMFRRNLLYIPCLVLVILCSKHICMLGWICLFWEWTKADISVEITSLQLIQMELTNVLTRLDIDWSEQQERTN